MAQAVERAYEHIRSSILSGHLEQGERLREELLADSIGVSRTPVREALHRLATDGLVRLTPNRGASVISYSERELIELYEVRALLESYAHGLAALVIDDADIETLAALAGSMDQAAADESPESRDRIAPLNNRFHQLIVESVHSKRLISLIQQATEVPLIHRTFHRYSNDALRRSCRQHHEIVEALRARDRDWAAAVMSAHVHAARATLLGAGTDD